MAERFRRMSEEAEQKGLAEPFRGITTNGDVMPGLFQISPSGVSTEPVRNAAEPKRHVCRRTTIRCKSHRLALTFVSWEPMFKTRITLSGWKFIP